MGIINAIAGFLTGPLNTVAWIYIFLPLAVGGGLYLTIRNRGIQFGRFGYAMRNTVGKMFKKQEAGKGAVTPMQAVTTALSATVGTGNIVGTTQAIALGGYGAVFWMWLAALVGMITKYSEVCLSIKYRERDAKGDWVGGPMYYIKNGLGKNWKWLGAVYCVLAALAAFGIGNATQVQSIGEAVGTLLAVVAKYVCAGAVGLDVSVGAFALIILAILFATQLVDNFLFQPLIYSSSVKAHPLEIFLVLLIVGHFAGALGMFVAIPAYTVLRVIAAKFFGHVKVVRKLTGAE